MSLLGGGFGGFRLVSWKLFFILKARRGLESYFNCERGIIDKQ